ncbi:hypothetical protein BO71DRAFT_432686 [Aspergillus ellipticus CBS 707.79]|uniref:NmrA-like domain-containing protein n=1 Tax=Aspergillus ellipticus CBS 707.79 TaxID=1448320 RepID=A0A319DU70_9EURO|nr:hypothetical protein BO71DRAFT_432686 [Aspergillus ellipticus CBS 707.79]
MLDHTLEGNQSSSPRAAKYGRDASANAGVSHGRGESVIRHLRQDPQLSSQFRIRAVTRDPSKPAAQALATPGVELVAADLNTPSSLLPALEGSHTVFLIVATFGRATGRAAVFVSVSREQAMASLPAYMADEYVETQLQMEEFGYYYGKTLDESLGLVESKPASLEEYFRRNAACWP